MSPHLDIKLCQTYPEIFAERHLSPRDTTMCWGFACGDGWYPLIDQLCTTLMLPVWGLREQLRHAELVYEAISTTDSTNDDSVATWKRVHYTKERVASLKEQLRLAELCIPIAMQVKEKFGRLCVHIKNTTPEQDAIVWFAEAMSERICEECGCMGTLALDSDTQARTYGIGWNRTLCPTHAIECYGADAVANYRNNA